MSAAILFVGLSMFAPADATQDAIKQELAKLDGEWVLVSGSSDGKPMSDEAIRTGRRTMKDGISTVTLKGELEMKAKYTIDPAKKPKAIDFVVLEGKTKGATRLGIYEIDGDTVRFNFAVPYKPRPETFTSKIGSLQTVSVWKRAPKEDKK